MVVGLVHQVTQVELGGSWVVASCTRPWRWYRRTPAGCSRAAELFAVEAPLGGGVGLAGLSAGGAVPGGAVAACELPCAGRGGRHAATATLHPPRGFPPGVAGMPASPLPL